MAQYSWKRKPKGAPKAAIAGAYIQQLARKNHGVSAEMLVESSRKRGSPLHKCFEWNDTQAAAEYRKSQARTILRSLTVTVQEDDDHEPVQVNAFVCLEEGPEYLSIQSVVSDEGMDFRYKRILLEDLRQCKRKVQAYEEFTEVVQAIDRVKIS